MNLKVTALIILLFSIPFHSVSQDYFSYGGGNFCGLNQIISNPAAAADNRLKLDIVLGGLDFNFNNSWFSIKRQMLDYKGSFLRPSTFKFPDTWSNLTPNVPDNIFKNFHFIKSPKTKAIILENRIILPSIFYQLNSKNSLAFTWGIRQIANADGFSPQFSYLFEKEMDLNVTQNNPVQNKNLALVQMSWMEFGFTYARVIRDKREHFIKAGITPKLLKGFESIYLLVRNLDFLFSTKDTSSYFNTDFSYAHSRGFENNNGKQNNSLMDFYRNGTRLKPGLDLGFIYEWRPHYENYKYKADGKNYTYRNDVNKYKLKLGVSVVDIGKITFEKEGSYYDIDAQVKRSNFNKFTSLKNSAQFDSLLKADFSTTQNSNRFSILLPTAVNAQADYSINRLFYLNLSAHITGFYKSNLYKVHNYTAFCFAPRFEHYWFNLSLPFTYNTLSANRYKDIMVGLNIRLGPFCLGTSDLKPLFIGDIASYNFYGLLKLAIPYKKLRDRDKDGVKDKTDECPDDPGEINLNGCPDKDHDGVPDKKDGCPNQQGLAIHMGCPDTDGDGIKDGDDQCPTEKGNVAFKGCPDSDGDSIIDKNDVCPEKRGLKKFKGCPDTDGDGIVDKEDLCPELKGLIKYSGCPDTDNDQIHDGIDQCLTLAGPSENKGCPWPDTDKDGVIDRLDSCITVAGLLQYHGCPPPIQLEEKEKRIIEKAFASLEFATGKDIIKPVSYPSLNALAKLLIAHKKDWKIKLSGHTDNAGTEESNFILSENRTKSVKKYLVKKDVPEENIVTEWFGQSRPIADNKSKEGKQKNRRVEMIIILNE